MMPSILAIPHIEPANLFDPCLHSERTSKWMMKSMLCSMQRTTIQLPQLSKSTYCTWSFHINNWWSTADWNPCGHSKIDILQEEGDTKGGVVGTQRVIGFAHFNLRVSQILASWHFNSPRDLRNKHIFYVMVFHINDPFATCMHQMIMFVLLSAVVFYAVWCAWWVCKCFSQLAMNNQGGIFYCKRIHAHVG